MINFLLITLVCLVAIPVFFLIVQLFSANLSSSENPDDSNVDCSNFVVLVPAHNEELVIEATLVSLMAQLPDRNQIIVIADNCVDTTAVISRGCGVVVIERRNELDKGKGFALEYGIEYLADQPSQPGHVIFIDADCLVKPGSLSRLVARCAETGGPVQSLNLMKTTGGADIRQKIAEFAWMVKNQVRPLGLMKLGLPCQLMGTGMVFPFELVKQIKLGSSNIVEDMKLGLDCAVAGYPPVFCPEALVESYFPEDENSVKTQRTRWEHGHLGVIFSETFGLLKSAIANRDVNSLVMSLDLMIPPLAFLVLILLAFILTLSVLVGLFGVGSIALKILLSITCLLGVALLAAWYRFARNIISLKELFWIPVYVVSKVPLYVGYWVRRQTEWIRTNRD
jgi:cellulose synthase/poly-beta-1,6-N-acetylglucosamine synthase-like glycosyltransferase